MIKISSVTKIYGEGSGRVDALKGVDVHIKNGQFVSIMGPSGSGKSTLLNLMSALDVPTSGTIEIDGENIAKLGDDAMTLFRRRKIGLIFQFFNLLPTLNALDNTLLPVMLERSPTNADVERGMTLLNDVGLGARARHFLHELSGGEIQRVAIARALMLRPGLLLADEPTGNLDSKTSAAILRLLRQISEDTGTTVVMVTHDRSAAEVGDRVLRLKDGQIEGDEYTASARQSSGSAAE